MKSSESTDLKRFSKIQRELKDLEVQSQKYVELQKAYKQLELQNEIRLMEKNNQVRENQRLHKILNEAKIQKNESDALTNRVESLHETARVNMDRYVRINRKNEELIAKMKIFES